MTEKPMRDSIDIFKLDKDNIIVSIRYGHKSQTETINIPWISIKSISIDNNELLIYHNASLSKFMINNEVQVMEDID